MNFLEVCSGLQSLGVSRLVYNIWRIPITLGANFQLRSYMTLQQNLLKSTERGMKSMKVYKIIFDILIKCSITRRCPLPESIQQKIGDIVLEPADVWLLSSLNITWDFFLWHQRRDFTSFLLEK